MYLHLLGNIIHLRKVSHGKCCQKYQINVQNLCDKTLLRVIYGNMNEWRDRPGYWAEKPYCENILPAQFNA